VTARVVSLRLLGMPDRSVQEAKWPARPNGFSLGQNVIGIHAGQVDSLVSATTIARGQGQAKTDMYGEQVECNEQPYRISAPSNGDFCPSLCQNSLRVELGFLSSSFGILFACFFSQSKQTAPPIDKVTPR
jgi:hypothetical protein